MSMTMNILFQIVAQAAKILNEEYDIEVFEAHHRNKVDAPSGTAMKVAQILCESTGRQFPDDINFHRQGVIGARKKSEIGMQVLRGGDIVGEHTVFFCGTGERLEIKHVATSRTTFAAGSIRAAKWLKDRKAGLYDMQDVLGLR
jgi:4-hydroxy-tetrahydrodipicolinate reductase